MRIQLVIAGGHAAKLFEAAKEPLNGVALGVARYVVGPRMSALASGWNHGLCTAGYQGGHQGVGIVTPVGNEEGWG